MLTRFTFSFIVCLFVVKASLCQISISPASGNYTVCPGQIIPYQATAAWGTNTSNCSYSWSVTNGRFYNDVKTGTSVSVIWDDKPETGTLTVTLTGCSNTDLSKDWSSEYTIKSVHDETPANPHTYSPLPYCSTNPVNLYVDDMTIPNTGGSSDIIQQFVDGYFWTLPTSWHNSDGRRGSFFTDSPILTIYPDNGCAGGTATVQGFVSCSNTLSNPASFNLNRTGGSVTISPATYASTYCKKTPVTFTATSYACGSNYVWSFPSGWTWVNPANPSEVHYSPVTIVSGNSITLTPTGDAIDQGSITATLNLDCGKSLQANTVSVSYTGPVLSVSGANPLCSSAYYSVVNLPSTASVSSWSSRNTSILNFTPGTSTANRVKNNKGLVTIDANINAGSCPALPPVSKSIWVGEPNFNSLAIDGTEPLLYADCGAGNITYAAQPEAHTLVTNLASGGSTSSTFALNDPSHSISAFVFSPIQYNFITKTSNLNFSITASSSNTCGTISQCIYFSNSGPCVLPQFTSVTIDGVADPYADCSNNLTYTSNQAHTIQTATNVGTPVTFTLIDPSHTVTGTVLSSTKYRFTSPRSDITFSIVANTNNACGTAQRCMTFSNSSVNPYRSAHKGRINVYPNPASSTLTVELTDSLSTNPQTNLLERPYELFLMDRFSQKVFSIQSLDKTIQIPIDALPPDIYYLNVFHNGAVLQRQIVIRR